MCNGLLYYPYFPLGSIVVCSSNALRTFQVFIHLPHEDNGQNDLEEGIRGKGKTEENDRKAAPLKTLCLG